MSLFAPEPQVGTGGPGMAGVQATRLAPLTAVVHHLLVG